MSTDTTLDATGLALADEMRDALDVLIDITEESYEERDEVLVELGRRYDARRAER